MGKNLSANAGDSADLGSISGWGRPTGGGNGTPLQYSFFFFFYFSCSFPLFLFSIMVYNRILNIVSCAIQ